MTSPDQPGHQSHSQPTDPYAAYASGPPTTPFGSASPQHGPPQPPFGYPGPPQRRAGGKRWLIPSLIGGGIALVLCCGGAMIAAGSDPQQTSEVGNASGTAPTQTASTGSVVEPTKAAPASKAAEAEPEPEAAVKTYRIGQRVRGGDFEFVVHSVKCGISQVGDSFLKKKAQGTFCRVVVSAKNVTKKAHMFHADGTVTAHDGRGREYEADGEANIYGNPSGAGFLDEINPGNSVRASVYFDVPKGTKLSKVVFDAGLFTLAEDAVVSL
ncbi:DUF4352 domain-containing protein [Micromonosporaceae bacterium B7E4]